MTPAPFVSIVIPTYRRPGPLAACLDSVLSLDYPRDRLELIVVDDGGGTLRDPLPPACAGVAVTLIRQPHAGPATARNAGARRARGTLVAFTDDDCVLDPSWARALVRCHADAPGDAIGGHTVNALSQNVYSSASQILVDYLYAYYNGRPGAAKFFTSNNLAFPRERFLAIGGFDESFGLAAAEDRELCDRWRGHGLGMSYAPEALVYHGHALTLRTFWQQHVGYGRGAVHFHRARAKRSGARLTVEPPAFYFRLLRYPLTRGPRARALQFTLLLALAQLANAAGFFSGRLHGARS